MLIAFYANLCEKTFQGLGIGSTCVQVSSDGTTVMSRDPDVKVDCVCSVTRVWAQILHAVNAWAGVHRCQCGKRVVVGLLDHAHRLLPQV